MKTLFLDKNIVHFEVFFGVYDQKRNPLKKSEILKISNPFLKGMQLHENSKTDVKMFFTIRLTVCQASLASTDFAKGRKQPK